MNTQFDPSRRIARFAAPRLLLTMLGALFVAVPSAHAEEHTVVQPDTLTWVDVPVFPGAKLAVIQGDPGKEGIFAYRVKLPANYKIAPHTHKAGENVTVLSGTFYLGLGEKFNKSAGTALPVGGFVAVPPKHPHFAWSGPKETVVQVHGYGPTDITFINPADDPRNKQ
ncbi:MAG: cupin domain-containing protein [Sulfurifustaceae bacterium]